ncbi:MAG TPA: calcium-binding protein, partial [Vicinamibacterales bacterium]
GNRVTVEGQFAYGVLGYHAKFALNGRIEAFAFKSDAENWSGWDVQQKLIVQETSSGNDVTHGFGDDDVFAASTGNDTLIGYDGQDTYHWATGAGDDTIDEQARYVDVNVGLGGLSLGVAADVVVFDAGIDPDDLIFARPTSASDLIITNIETGETLTVKNQFDSFQTGVLGAQWMNRIEWFSFTDGTAWSWQDILLKVTTGTAGNDSLYGDLFADTLTGGAGNDYLSGMGYGDTYVFNLGDGQDTIEDANNFVLGAGFITIDSQPDTLVLGAGITTADISFEHTGSDIKLLIGNGGDSVLLKGQDDYMQTGVFGAISTDRIEKIQFADGTVWTWQELQQHVIEAATTSGNDTIAGFSMEDTFAASAGDDLMMGGDSSDTYEFGYGSGHDEIRDNATNIFYSNTDVVEFGPGVDTQDVSLARDGNDLVITLAGSSDQLRITDQFLNYIGYQWHTVEQFKFADGTVWSNVDVQNKLLVGTSGDDTITGFFTEDVLTGGAGNDILRGGDGGDTYIFNRGDGQDRIEEGVDFANLGDNDTIQFGASITLADLAFSRSGNDLIIGITGSSDQITVVNQFDQFAWLTTDDVENFRFADGSVLSKDDVSAILLAGTSGDDNLVGTSGNDRLDGGAGNDTLSGGNGSDTYVFGRGYGQDTIIESVDQVIIGDDDRLVFKDGIAASDLTYTRDGNDLIISINGTSDSVRMVGEFAYSAWYTWNDVERFEFADGTIITKEEIRQQILTSTTTNHIVGFASDDTLQGGAGDDILEGGDGSDTYFFGRGSGNDRIVEQLEWGTSTENDTLRFKAGVAPGDVTVTRVGQDVVFTLDTGESVRVIGQFVEGYNEFLSSNDVEQVVFDDGTVWDKVEIARRSIHVSEGKDTVIGTWYAETIDGGAGDDTIQAGGGNDTLIGGLGNDQLGGGGGDDTYVYSPGDGNDVIQDENFGGNGANRIQFGVGITAEALRFTHNAADASEMTISFVDAAGSLKLIGQWGATGDNAIEFLDFADGTTWNVAQIAAAFVAQQKSAGDDTIYGYNGADVIAGGAGNDRLVGGAGDDVYVFERGDGVDTIADIGVGSVWGNQDGGNDRIEFGANIAPTDVTISQSSPTDITLQINGTGDRLILTNAINDPRMRIEEVHFGNGTVWTIAQILAQSLLGTPGNDTLNGTTGSDIIAGGAGNDSLAGGGGDDYYRFGRGDGVDTIYDAGPNNLFGPTDGGYDTVQLGANITAADIRVFETSASDIAIQIIGTSDQLTLAGTVNTPILRIEAVSFADGTYWTFADLRARAITPTSGDDVFYAGDLSATLSGGAGNDSLYGSNAADDLSGGTGNDALAGGGGDDIYRFGRGDGVDTITDIGPNNLFGPTDGGYDTIQLGPNITAADVRVVETSANNIAIQIIGTGDQLNINGTLSSSILRVEAVKFADGTTWSYTDLRARALTPTSGDDVFYAGDTPAALLGGAGNDTLYGSDGSDDLAGGTGNDTLYGGWGDDTYRFARGDGADYIYDRGPERWWGVENGGFDHVELAAGIALADIEVLQVGDNDIVLKIRGTSDQLTLSGTVTDTTRRIEEVRFADGTVWTHADLLNKILEQENRFGATSGNDHITATNGNETVIGLAGNDWINAREVNDILIGGMGNDDLGGGAGDDVYRFSVGDGQDRIFESIEDWVGGQGGNDRIELGAGIAPGQVTVTQPGGGDLLLDFGGGDSILISRSPITNATFAVEQVVFADGTIWTAADLFARSITPTTGADRFYGTPGADTISGGAGNDRLNGREGDDILIGGTGNDDMGGGAGNDIYRFSVGDGQDRI